MRLVGVVVAALLATTVAASPGRAPGSGLAGGASEGVLVLGDSLSVGTAPYLRSLLGGYRFARRHHVGLRASDAAEIVSSSSETLPRVLVVSAGTNDDPRRVWRFRSSVSRILRVAGAERCVVWPTIVRPPVAGVSYDRLNRALALAARNTPSLVLIDWVGMVRRHSRWLSADGVHAAAVGYRARARAIAEAVKTRCAT